VILSWENTFMRILGIETSCDETGIALYDTTPWEAGKPANQGLLGQALHSQVAMHEVYGGVVPELASRDHIRRILPLMKEALKQANMSVADVDAVAFTQGPGLAGALLVGASVAKGLALGLNKPIIGVHHLEGHLLSPLLAENFIQEAGKEVFPFVALLVSGGHTQLMLVKDVGEYQLLGETLDDAAGEAFDKTAKLLGLSYPGGPAVSALAKTGKPGRFKLPRPMKHSKDLDFSFAGLKTAVLTQTKHLESLNPQDQSQFKADLASDFVEAVVDVLTSKTIKALEETGCERLVIAGGVGANEQLRASLQQAASQSGGKKGVQKFTVHYPPLNLCTDNGAMIAFAGALRALKKPELLQKEYGFDVKPRWPLNTI
jgi:N6-L-threonylcarbamoyladenine synthase